MNPFGDDDDPPSPSADRIKEESSSARSNNSTRSTNPFDEVGSDEKSSAHSPKRDSTNPLPGKRPAPLPRRKSSLLSGQDPIDVSILSGDEKKMILMGVSIQAAQDTLTQADGLKDALKTLATANKSLSGKQAKLWTPPFQMKVTSCEVNSISGKKPFTEYSVLGKDLTLHYDTMQKCCTRKIDTRCFTSHV